MKVNSINKDLNGIQKNNLKAFERYFETYENYWGLWVIQPECSCSEREIEFVAHYRYTGTFRHVSGKC